MTSLKPLERRIAIIKLLQEGPLRTSEVAEKLDVFSDRTIREDLLALRDGINVFGTTIKIDSSQEGSQKHFFTSNVHPIMLALNATEVYALLKVLEEASLKNEGGIYERLFDCVYSQLTDYGQSLIKDKLTKNHEAKEITNVLEEEAYNNRSYQLSYWIKSGRYLDVSYLNKNNEFVTVEYRLQYTDGEVLTLKDRNNTLIKLPHSSVFIDWKNIEYL